MEQQPVPRAFAPAAGQTAAAEVKLTSLPEEVQQVPGIAKHQFARPEGGTILIVGDCDPGSCIVLQCPRACVCDDLHR